MPGKYELFGNCLLNIRKCISHCFFPIDSVADSTFRIIIPLILTTFYHVVPDFANMGIWNMFFSPPVSLKLRFNEYPSSLFFIPQWKSYMMMFCSAEFLVLPWISYASCRVCVCFLISYVPAGQYAEWPIYKCIVWIIFRIIYIYFFQILTII